MQYMYDCEGITNLDISVLHHAGGYKESVLHVGSPWDVAHLPHIASLSIECFLCLDQNVPGK